MPSDLRIGVDVGGTNTDAVVLDTANNLLAKCKVATTADVTTGITLAIRGVLSDEVPPARVTHVMIGTTHATNAVLERRGLRRTAVIRIAAPASHEVRPLFGWPDDLREAVSVGHCIVHGGFEFNGNEIAPFDGEEVLSFLRSLPQPIESVAITSIFSPVSADHENAAAEIIRQEFGGDVHISLSHEIGSIGLIERENATVLNEALVGAAQAVTDAIMIARQENGLGHATVYFAQNDGTLMPIEQAAHFPVLTIGSGPANSMRGAAYLTGVNDAIVVDVGGTSSDIGVLVNGFPRESAIGVTIGGVSTNFRMPDLVSLALGGGTIVHGTGDSLRLGPESVGYRLTSEAQVFGGNTATVSDATVASGRADFGTHPASSDPETLAAALALSDEMLAEGIDRVKTSRTALPLVAVGGGSVILPDHIDGVSEVLRPDNFDVANAIGAAIGTVSGQVDKIFVLDKLSREEAIAAATSTASELAVKAGAAASDVEIVSLEEIPLTYLAAPAVRIRVKAAGPLDSL